MCPPGGPDLPPPPPDWPEEADQDFERIRVLGKGAFGEVWLARRRGGGDEYVAIKGVSIQTENEGATAAREMAILSELSHPNIIRLLCGYGPASVSAKGRYMALSFVNGPDIGALLEERGALGIPLAHKIAQDLIAAVAYLHARGVMHRDIKPDNIMLEGCLEGKEKWIDDDIMWGDDKKCQAAVNKRGFKAILADFGFARAMTPEDFEDETNELTIENERISSFDKTTEIKDVNDDGPPITAESDHSNNSNFKRKHSRVILRGKSACGTKHFAAPEIEGTVRGKNRESALTPCVSDYALISDAYAVGATLSEIVTGVPPGEDIDIYVAIHRKKTKLKSPLEIIVQPVYKTLDALTLHHLSGHKKHPHEIQLRRMNELPPLVSDLIQNLMIPDVNERLSVREAQEHLWIGGYDALPHGDVPSRPGDSMVFLPSASAHIVN